MNAHVIGPVNGGARGRPFGSSVRDLAAVGYVEEEFFLLGEATRYALSDGTDYGFDGRWSVREHDAVPFRTRFLVRQPVDRERFNGVVLVNWNNVSAGFELPSGTGAEIIESGCAWVGVSAQRIGIHGHPLLPDNEGLVAWDAERYGQLAISDDDASFDIFTQVARAVGGDRSELQTDPMHGLEVEHLVALGASQSANRLATYYNAIQPETRAFDAFLMAVYSGGGTRVEALGPGPSLALVPDEARAIVNVMPFGSHQLRGDIDARAFVLNSETEAGWYYPVRQPDSDTYRLWEIAGVAHIGIGTDDEVDAQLMRDVGRLLADSLTNPIAAESERAVVSAGRGCCAPSRAHLGTDGRRAAVPGSDHIRGRPTGDRARPSRQRTRRSAPLGARRSDRQARRDLRRGGSARPRRLEHVVLGRRATRAVSGPGNIP